MRKGFLVLSVLAFAILATAAQINKTQALSTAILPLERVPGEIVVKLKEESGVRGLMTTQSILAGALGDNAILQSRILATDEQVSVIRIQDDAKMNEAVVSLRSNDQVLYAEPNYIYRAIGAIRGTMPSNPLGILSLPNDPKMGQLWGMKNTGQTDGTATGTPGADIDVERVWDMGHRGSKDVLVAVIDTGVDWDHPDLAANLYTNPGEIAGNGIDDDANGFVDDIHGWNFVANNNNSDDDNDHGTHCSGTIGGVGNNGEGVAGVNWAVSILPVKFLSASGSGSLAGAVDSVNYAAKMGAKIMSNSWGGGGANQALLDAIKNARDKGALFVAAAGNDGVDNDTSPHYPANYDVENVLSVAATTNKDERAYFSCYGKRTVHVAAPGYNIVSTVKGGGYASFSGTSMATPHVSGIAALLASIDPTMTYAQLKDRLIRTSVPVPALKRLVASKGRVSAYNAVTNTVPPNSDPNESDWKDVAYSLESAHPYTDNMNATYPIQVQGARFIRVVLERVELEDRYDFLKVETPAGAVVDSMSGSSNGVTTEYAQGDSLVLRLTTDSSVTKWGFKVAKVQVVR